MDPTSDDAFDRRVAFFRSVARSQGRGALTMALITNAVDDADRPAVRAARALHVRRNGRWVRDFVAKERVAFHASR